jgi:hypothetical protein
MECDKQQLIHWMNGQMTEAEREAFETHLIHCEDCQREHEISRHVLDVIEHLPAPEPSPDMRLRFQGMIDAYKDSLLEKKSVLPGFLVSLQQLWTIQPKLKLAYAIVLILVGMGAGYLINQQSAVKKNDLQISALSTQLEDMRQLMMLSLVENPSASKRLQGVSYTEDISAVNEEVIEALLTTLNEDPNVNVRLATLEALVNFAALPRVREGLVQSIVQQESPLLQSAMVDVMLKLQEKSSVKQLQKLLDRKDLNQSVKAKIENSITHLI